MNIIYSIFVSLVWFLSTYFTVVLMLILFTKKSDLYEVETFAENSVMPKVSIIVPVYNEEETIGESIESLKSIDYPKELLEIIILNDGSKDNTSSEILKHSEESYITFIDNKENKGKAGCLNQGIILAKGEFIGCMDADSEVSPDILKKTLPMFTDPKVGAVTVSVEVKNPKTFLEKIIEVEYIIGLSLALRALSFLNAIHVTPGPFSIYRKSIIQEIGLFDTKNITEDLEIAYRLQKHKYKIKNCLSTKVRTVSPANLKSLYIQRKRWYSGSLMTLWKHKKVIFDPKIGTFAFIMPYTFILVTLGLSLFGFSAYLSISNLVKSLKFYALTNYNFFSYLSLKEFDILTISSLTFLGITSICITIITAYISLRLANKHVRKRIPGFLGFFFLFFLYQIFWASSFFSVLFGRRVKWR